ncbi:Glycoside hydrolase, family 61 [Penicillium griseofulvum]|uniref:Glycoside hydrolase, family 61 n=1 Tax=Penicillium patulum TaxID=5078 RepID=A0A135LXX8_PENPA|nr:Glycoside hydrolase, family 61 [Penicillium griseofulvum]KXG53771.1 Glycoside hydrolase, family 61 [Penicillium griseofulvum]
MTLAKLSTLLASATLVAGHGYVSSIVADGKNYTGYLVDKYSHMDPAPESVGWTTTATDLGFEDGTEYQDPNIICHRDGTNAALSATVKAGSDVEIQWTTWPESHHGPVITYLAACNGDCSTVDKAALEFFKIEEDGLIDGASPPGHWATDDLIAAGGKWTVRIPATIAAGNYVMRHEIIGLHSAGNKNGAQNYPQCFNLAVTGGGSDKPKGKLGVELYTNTDPGILFDLYSTLKEYIIPGPPLYA